MMKLNLIAVSFIALALTGCASVRAVAETPPCTEDSSRQGARAAELQQIVAADQKGRGDWQHMSPEEISGMNAQDVQRRKRVGEIFGEGCFKTAKDFAAAALVFQHGDVPDHYYQAFLWARRAVELGDSSQKSLESAAIDRYLVSLGYKQLFGTQAHLEKIGPCFCLQQVETEFTDDKRKMFMRPTLAGALIWVDGINQGKSCPPAHECPDKLKPNLAGSVPGIW